MDRRTLLAVVLSVGIWYIYIALNGPPVGEEEPVPEPAPVTQPVAPDTPVPTDAPVRELAFSSCDFQATLTTDGGGFQRAVLPDHEGPLEITPIYSYLIGLVTGGPTEWHPYGESREPETLLSGEAHALVAGSGNPAAGTRRFEVVSETADQLVLRSVGTDGVEVRQTFTRRSGSGACTFDVSVTWTNGGGSDLAPGDVWFGMFDAFDPPGGMFAAYQNRLNAYARVDADLEYGSWSEPEEGAVYEPEPLENERAAWIALADRYFGVFALPADKQGRVAWAQYGPTAEGAEPLRGMIWSPATGLAAGDSATATFSVYVGPHDTDVLAAIDETLVEIVDFGMFAVFCWPLLFALQWLHGMLGNWGLAIIVLTVAVKIVFFPLTQSAFKSGEKMKTIQPLMNEIREKYKDQPEELNRQTMELFKEHRVNPLGGCLPMFIQMPVFLSLFYVLMYSADLYHTDFLYLQDLSSPDPTCILPAIVVALMLVQQQFTPMGNMDPAQARMMKMMPLMFGFFWFMFPSGLVVYYFINTVLSVLQQWWIRRTLSTTGTPVPEA